MRNVIKSAIANIGVMFKQLQVKQFFAVVLVGFLLLTTNIAGMDRGQALTNKVEQLTDQNNSDRPKTVGEWNKEARQTEDAPLERVKRIGKESAEAVKDFGGMYADTAEKTTPDLDNNMR
ncbi:hypothetical protein [Rivularia sp. UHCC 0363]|uniref:hypothetical protein n=1 Tax=Rivularia sp. UHCC 0363 TaxID=3110244 RepID=UPI002B21C023|nr:hypothetical protein [Rivularia sp. UHCC 0363]MEA5597552.1 hypothetical protein [Rivularia sp. UHCC 0363]